MHEIVNMKCENCGKPRQGDNYHGLMVCDCKMKMTNMKCAKCKKNKKLHCKIYLGWICLVCFHNYELMKIGVN